MSALEVLAGTVQNPAEQSEPQWLIDALNLFEEKHKSSYDVLAKFTRNDSPPTMRQLLKVGYSRENELVDRHNRNVENLVRHQDLDKQLISIENEKCCYLVFKAYLHAAKIIRKLVKDNIDIPEYDGTGNPEDYGQACYDRINTVAGNRLEFVKQYLSDLHIHYAEKNISTKRTSVRTDQIAKANLQRLSSRQAETRNIANSPSVPPEPVVAHATTQPISSPVEAPLSERVSFEHSDRTPVSGFRAVRREGLSVSPLTPHDRKRFRGDSEQVPAEFILPASNSNTTSTLHHVFSLGTEPKSNFPVVPNPINAVIVGTQPTILIDDSCLQSAMTKVAEECPEELESLMKETACPFSATVLERRIRACQFALKNGSSRERYQRIVATLTNWIFLAAEEIPTPACDMKEIEAEIWKHGREEQVEVEHKLLDLQVSRVVDQKMELIRSRRNAVFSMMAEEDRDALEDKIRHEKPIITLAVYREVMKSHTRSLREKQNSVGHSSAQQTGNPWPQNGDLPWSQQP